MLPVIPDYPLTQDQIDQYRRDGFVMLSDVIVGPALDGLRSAVMAAVEQESAMDRSGPKGAYEKIFNQKVNIWQRHPDVRAYTLQPALARIAARLEGVPMRLWHDQALFKEPGLGDNRTPWHQDAVYWPHVDRWRQTSIWIALADTTLRNGCMSFMPHSHTLGPKKPVDLADPGDLFGEAPEMRSVRPVTCPMIAGSVISHNGLNFHYIGPNRSDAVRMAYAIIFMPDGTVYDGAPHMVTDPLGLAPGAILDGDTFPLLS
jgi:phytanoyl-CoA hydroxylase